MLVFMRLHWRVEPCVAWLAGRRVKLRRVVRVLRVPPVHRVHRGGVCVGSRCLGSAVGLPWVCRRSAVGLPVGLPCGLPWASAASLPWACLRRVRSRRRTLQAHIAAGFSRATVRRPAYEAQPTGKSN